ncbi:MAG TPA: KOW motif-containing protein, partial [Caulobacteraceae bacterium]
LASPGALLASVRRSLSGSGLQRMNGEREAAFRRRSVRSQADRRALQRFGFGPRIRSSKTARRAGGALGTVLASAVRHGWPPRERGRRAGFLENLMLEVEMTNVAAPYEPGDSVLVVNGPFASFKGVVRDVDAVRDALSVEVTMFGRPVPIQTEFWQVMLR